MSGEDGDGPTPTVKVTVAGGADEDEVFEPRCACKHNFQSFPVQDLASSSKDQSI